MGPTNLESPRAYVARVWPEARKKGGGVRAIQDRVALLVSRWYSRAEIRAAIAVEGAWTDTQEVLLRALDLQEEKR